MIASRVVVALMLVAGGTVISAGPAGAASSWSIVPSASPAGAPNADLFDVACPSETSCFAVGNFVTAASSTALAEHWDGAKWSIMPVPAVVGGFRSISCPSTTSCTAVGGSGSTMLAARWNGTTWSIMPVADPGTGSVDFLTSVACSSDSSCMAVGYAAAKGVSARWDGAKWSIVPIPRGAGASYVVLNGVACPSATLCFAVGFSISASDSPADPLIEQWDGTRWSITASSNPVGHDFNLADVSCSSAISCFAVGNYIPRDDPGPEGVDGPESTLIEAWDGESWSAVASPNVDGANLNFLVGVSCSSATFCFATGAVELTPSGPLRRGLIEQWNGTSWSISASPLVDPSYSLLRGVGCSSATNCFAVGSRKLQFPPAGLVEHWNGSSWSATTYPAVNPTPSNATLAGVACATATKCFGVGQYTNSAGSTIALIERPAGNSWSVVAAGGAKGSLSSVSCPSPKVCVAVGTTDAGGGLFRTLAVRWNGTSWSVVPSPNVNLGKVSLSNRLWSLSCSSASDCFAVGDYYYKVYKTLILHWDGKQWTVVASPNRAPTTTTSSLLAGVSCSSATSCFAVGQSQSKNNQPTSHRTLTERWNGHAWTIVPSPNAVTGVGELTGVSCSGPNTCVAVGSASRALLRQSLVETWNGTAWTRAAGADPASATRSELSGVSCTSPTSCVAVGSSSGTSKPTKTLVKRFAGGHWTIVSSPNPTGARNSYLRAVSCPTATSCFAVGTYDTNGAPRTLVERYS